MLSWICGLGGFELLRFRLGEHFSDSRNFVFLANGLKWRVEVQASLSEIDIGVRFTYALCIWHLCRIGALDLGPC